MKAWVTVLAVLVSASAVARVARPAGEKTDVEKAYRDAWQRPEDTGTFERLRAALPRFESYAVVEGDILMTEKELVRYATEKSIASQLAAPKGGELIVNTESGVPTYWTRDSRQSSYAVDRASFGNDRKYETVVAEVAMAARAWMKACPSCGLDLMHMRQQDNAPSPGQVTFIVRAVDAGGAYIAAAFFPTTPMADEFLTVIHHPECKPKQITDACTVVDASYPAWVGTQSGIDFTHRCDTEEGSSGGAILDQEGRLIGLHHKGFALTDDAVAKAEKKNAAMRVDQIRTFLRACNAESDSCRPGLDALLEDRP